METKNFYFGVHMHFHLRALTYILTLPPMEQSPHLQPSTAAGGKGRGRRGTRALNPWLAAAQRLLNSVSYTQAEELGPQGGSLSHALPVFSGHACGAKDHFWVSRPPARPMPSTASEDR